MRNPIFVFLLFALCSFFLILQIHNVASLEDAYVDIEVSYFANYDFPENDSIHVPDMSDDIFLGSQTDPFGSGNVKIMLTEDGQTVIDIVDDYDFPDDDVPGLHVLRGEDVIGPFIQFNLHGNNDVNDREEIKFNLKMVNSVFSKAVSLDFGDYEGFELFNNNNCSIVEGHPGANVIGDDEYNFVEGENKAEVCSITGSSVDRVRVYYNLQDTTPPVISDIRTDPNLTLINKGQRQELRVWFNSSEYPIHTKFFLYDPFSSIIEEQGAYKVEGDNDLPLIFTIPMEDMDFTFQIPHYMKKETEQLSIILM